MVVSDSDSDSEGHDEGAELTGGQVQRRLVAGRLVAGRKRKRDDAPGGGGTTTRRSGGGKRKRKAKWPFPAYMAVRPSKYGAAGDFLVLLVAF